MTCPEYLRLRQDYEASLRHWGQVMLSYEGEARGPASDVKRKAYEERDEAKLKLNLHRDSCPICFKDKWRTFDTLRKPL
jgi:hypothetical protein